jgi:diguanylate cyclase (GGDEF)-like protein
VLLRYGGEECVIVLLGAGRDDLVQMAERVRHAVSEAEIDEAGQRIRITVSIGGSGLPDKNAANAQDLVLVADAAMYTSKEFGRDRCVVA